MGDNSMLLTSVTSDNASIYPSVSGTLLVYRVNAHRTMLFFGCAGNDKLYYGNYYETTNVETWSGWVTYLATSGGTLTGDIKLQKSDNGYAVIMKSHNNESDYGLHITDTDSEGKTARLVVSAKNNAVYYKDTENAYSHELYGHHNRDKLISDIAHYQKVYNDLQQIGLTVGSETIKDIATKLPVNSRLVLTVSGVNNLSIYPNSNYGLLIVDKTSNSRIIFTFTNNSGTQWTGAYAVNSAGDIWTDWKMVYNSAYITSGTVDLVDGSTALASGRVHLVYE
jgi:hypothetical protein